MNEWITRKQARAYFEQCGLSFKDIHRYDIYLLMAILGKEFHETRDCPDSSDYVFPKMSGKLKYKRSDGRLVYAHLYMNGAYFKERQCISFEPTGFIGFAGWASDGNVQPVLRAFIRWCDVLRQEIKADDAE